MAEGRGKEIAETNYWEHTCLLSCLDNSQPSLLIHSLGIKPIVLTYRMEKRASKGVLNGESKEMLFINQKTTSGSFASEVVKH